MIGTRTNTCGLCGIILLVLSNVVVSQSMSVLDFDPDIYNDDASVEFEGSVSSRTSRQVKLSSEILPTSPIICRRKSSTKRYPNPLYIRRLLDPGRDFYVNPRGYVVGSGAAKLNENNAPASVRRVMSVFNAVLQPLKLTGVALPITIRGRNGVGVTFQNAFFEGIPLVDVSKTGFVKVLILQQLSELPNKLPNGRPNYTPNSNTYLECKQESQITIKYSGTNDISMLSEAVGNLPAGTGTLKSLTSLSQKVAPASTSQSSSVSASAANSAPLGDVSTASLSPQERAQKISALVIQLKQVLDKERADIAVRRQAREEQQKVIRRKQQEQRRTLLKEKSRELQLDYEIKQGKLSAVKKNRKLEEQRQIQKLQEAFEKEHKQKLVKMEESEILFQKMVQGEDDTERARDDAEEREKFAKLEKQVLEQLLAIKKKLDDEKKENEELQIRLQQQLEERKRKEGEQGNANLQQTVDGSGQEAQLNQKGGKATIEETKSGLVEGQSSSAQNTEEGKLDNSSSKSQNGDAALEEEQRKMEESGRKLRSEYSPQRLEERETFQRTDGRSERSDEPRSKRQKVDLAFEEEKQKMEEDLKRIKPEDLRAQVPQLDQIYQDEKQKNEKIWGKIKSNKDSKSNSRSEDSADDPTERPDDPRPETKIIDPIYADEKQKNDKVWKNIKSNKDSNKDTRSETEEVAAAPVGPTSGPDEIPERPDDFRPGGREVDEIFQDERQKTNKIWKKTKSENPQNVKTEETSGKPGAGALNQRPEEPSSKSQTTKMDQLSEDERQKTDSQVKNTESSKDSGAGPETPEETFPRPDDSRPETKQVDPIYADETQKNDKVWKKLGSKDSSLKTDEVTLRPPDDPSQEPDEPSSKLQKTDTNDEEEREKGEERWKNKLPDNHPLRPNDTSPRPAGFNSEITKFEKILQEEKKNTDEYFRKIDSRSRLRPGEESTQKPVDQNQSQRTESRDQKLEDTNASSQSSKSVDQNQSSPTTNTKKAEVLSGNDDTTTGPAASSSTSNGRALDRELVRKLVQDKVEYEQVLRSNFPTGPPSRPSTGSSDFNILNILTIRLGRDEKLKVDGIDVAKTDSEEAISEEVTSKKENGTPSKTKLKTNRKRTISCVERSLKPDAPTDSPTNGLKLLDPESSIFKSTKRGTFALSYLRSILSTIGPYIPAPRIFNPDTLFATVSTDRNGILQGGLVEIIARFLEPARLPNVVVQPIISTNGKTVGIIAGKTVYEAKLLLDGNSLKSSAPRTVLHLYKLAPAGINYEGIQIYKYEGGQFTDCHEEFGGKRYISEGDTKNERRESILGNINLRELFGALT